MDVNEERLAALEERMRQVELGLVKLQVGSEEREQRHQDRYEALVSKITDLVTKSDRVQWWFMSTCGSMVITGAMTAFFVLRGIKP